MPRRPLRGAFAKTASRTVAPPSVRTVGGRDSRATVLTVWQPLSRLLTQEWLFAQGQLMGAAGRPPR